MAIFHSHVKLPEGNGQRGTTSIGTPIILAPINPINLTSFAIRQMRVRRKILDSAGGGGPSSNIFGSFQPSEKYESQLG